MNRPDHPATAIPASAARPALRVERLRRLPRAAVLAATGAAALGLIGLAVLVQQAEGLEPCPLCILQRYAFAAVGGLALAAAVARGRAGTVLAALALAAALAGTGVAVWHVRLQLDPPAVASCGPGLAYMLAEMPLGRALPRIFAGGGDCTAIDWRLLGLTMPMWSALWLAFFAALLGWLLRRGARGA